MNFSEYMKLDERAKASTRSGVFANKLDDAKNYTDEKIKELERKLSGGHRSDGEVAPKYTVVPSQSIEGDVLIIIDVEQGTMEGRLAARGRLVSHPLVYGNKVAFAVQRPNKDKIGVIHSLPDGQLINQFRITGEATEGTEISPIFRREEDFVKQVGNVFPAIISTWIEDQNEDSADIGALKDLLHPDQSTSQPVAPVAPVADVQQPPTSNIPPTTTGDVTSPVTQLGVPQRMVPATQAAPTAPTGRTAPSHAAQSRSVSNRAARIRRLRAHRHF